jgi:hypothetical protein
MGRCNTNTANDLFFFALSLMLYVRNKRGMMPSALPLRGSFRHRFQHGSRSHLASYPMDFREILSREGVKWPGREAYHSP